jgi:microcin C transport system permease protein
LGITALVFSIIRIAPGGPVEQSLARLMGGEGTKRSRIEASASLTAAQVLEVEEKHDRDKLPLRGYAEWLGLMPRDLVKVGKEFPHGATEMEMTVPGTVHTIKVARDEKNQVSFKGPDGVDLSMWRVRLRTPEEQAKRWSKWLEGAKIEKMPEYRAVLFKPGYDGLLQGSLGNSSKYQDPVWSMILARMPVSIWFGVFSMLAIYGICLPLGILKAIKHRSFMDNFSSLAVFAGYAVPGFALGSLMLVYLGARWDLFPLRGFTGDDFNTLSFGGKVKDLASHTFMPMVCYLVGSFAFMTLLVKNNLMDNLASDYVRTATAKGVSYPSAVFRHAFGTHSSRWPPPSARTWRCWSAARC